MNDADRKIVLLLQEDSRLSYAELGKQVGLSVSAVNERIKKLQAQGVIEKYVALINPEKAGIDVHAFVQVLIDRPENEAIFIHRIQEIDEVQECHCITGEYGFLLKVHAKNTSQFETLLKEKIKPVKGVVRTHTLVVLSSQKKSTKVAIDF